MSQINLNNVKTTLTAAVGISDTTINVAAGEGAQFALATGGNTIRATLIKVSGFKEVAWEIVDITARATDALTVVRAIESTTALEFSVGDIVEVRATAGLFDGKAALAGSASQSFAANALTANTVVASAGRSGFYANSEAYSVALKYVSTGSEIYLGATAATAPGFKVSNAVGTELFSCSNALAFNIPGTLGVTGTITAAGGIGITGGGFAAGSVYKGAVSGFTIGSITGSSYDFALYNPAGSYEIMRVPTGTLDVRFGGALMVGSASDDGVNKLQVTGSIKATTDLHSNGNLSQGQATPTAKTTSVTLTIAELLTKIITVNNTGTLTMTLPTGTLTDGGVTFANNQAFDWTIITIGGINGDVTVAAGTAHTVVGNMYIAGSVSATFRTRKTAANTYVTYRMA